MDKKWQTNKKLYILVQSVYSFVFHSQREPVCVVDPSLPPWSLLTQMERPNCSGCLTIKAPTVGLNYINSKQFLSRRLTKRRSLRACPSSWEALWFTIKIKPVLFVIIRGNIYGRWAGRVQWKTGEPLIHCAVAYHRYVLENQRKMWFRTCGSVCSGKEELQSVADSVPSLLMITERDCSC